MKLVEAVLSVLASAFICALLLGGLAMGTINWWPANCLHDGPTGFACQTAAFYSAWWWLAVLFATPIVAVLLFAGSGRYRR